MPRMEVRRRVGWEQLLEIVLEVHELGNGLTLDLPADKYEEIINLVEHERERNEPGVHIAVGRKEDVIVLTATSDGVDGQAKIASIMGIDGSHS